MLTEVKKFFPNILMNEVRMEKFKRGQADPQFMAMMQN
jgi:hypothetical protein